MEKQGFELAILPTRMANYTTLPIMECIFCPKRVLFNVKVPVKHIYYNYRILKFVKFFLPSPLVGRSNLFDFWQHMLSCKFHTWDYTCIAPLETSECDREKGLVCRIPQQLTNKKILTKCAHQLVHEGSTQQLKEVCAYSCQHSSNTEVILHLHDSKFLITNIQPHKYIICNEIIQQQVHYSQIYYS